MFSIFQGFLSKQNQVYSEFIQAYNEIKQLKNIKNNLQIMSNCLILEKSQGQSKCLSYYVLNEIDKVFLNLIFHSEGSKVEPERSDISKGILHLSSDLGIGIRSLRNKESYSRSVGNSPSESYSTQIFQKNAKFSESDLEDFYCSIFNIFDESYLRSDFWNLIWKFKGFSRLCKCYSEKCVEYNVFNLALASYMLEHSLSNPLVLEGLVIVCEMEKYCKYFDEFDFCTQLLNKIKQYARELNDKCIDILLFACYYSDRTGLDLLDRIEIDVSGIENTKEAITQDLTCENQLIFLLKIFREVKSKRIRYKVILESCRITVDNHNMFFNFIIDCIKIDSFVVGMALCKPEPNKWEPNEILRLIYVRFDKDILNEYEKIESNGDKGTTNNESKQSINNEKEFINDNKKSTNDDQDASNENKISTNDNKISTNDDSIMAEDKITRKYKIFSDDQEPETKFKRIGFGKPLKSGDISDYFKNNLHISFNNSSYDSTKATEAAVNPDYKKRQALLLKATEGDIEFASACLEEKAPLMIKRDDASLLETIMMMKNINRKIILFLYCFDRQTFFNNLANIIEISQTESDKQAILEFFKEEIAL